ncbi:reverse transcriptase domain-containing protein [Tanacetum coccineum]|uniref:Reverse transcriptase domain-containing protein n=1 Tax=Tanacetum coccineum TaxID=301880 RepID=A0ABQ5JDP1_9ASTR
MTRSSTKELLSPFENPEQKFGSKRRLFDTPSLIESNSPEFDHIFDIEEQSEEGERETMTETMEQYMSKTQENYGGSEHEDTNEHIKKVLEIVDLFHIPKVTQDQIMLQAFPVSLTGAASRWLRNQPSGSITTWKVLKTKFLNKYCPPARTAKKMEEINNFQQEPDESLFRAWERFKEVMMKCPQHYLTDMQEVILFYNGLDVPTRQILDTKGAIPSKTATDAKVAIQEMVEYSQKWHSGTSLSTKSTETSDRLAAIQAQLNNLRREIKKVNEKVYAAQVGCELCKGPHYTKDSPQKEERKTLEEAYYTRSVHHINLADNIEQQGQDSTNKIIETLPLVDLGASVSVMPFFTYTNLGLGILSHTGLTIELADCTIKQPRGIAENVLVRIGKFIFPIDFIILDIPEDNDVPLILGRPFLSTAQGDESFNPTYGDYIELNDLDTPLETKTNQDDFVPIFVKTGSYKMEFFCVIGYKYVIADLLPSLPINLMSKSFYYSISGDKDEGKSHAETLIDIPVFVESFSIISGFTIIDDEEITKGVVLGMRFCKKYASCQRIMKKFALENNCERTMENE